MLADQNILRVDGGSELILERLAASPDREDRATVVRLLAGNLQLVVTAGFAGRRAPPRRDAERHDLPAVLRRLPDHRRRRLEPGGGPQRHRRGGDRQRHVEGRADEEAVIDDRADEDDRQADVREAGGFDTLERWARQLDDEYAGGRSAGHVDDNLRYAAAPLNRYGSWVDVNGSSYWRPRVAADWRPYWQGRWVYTPSGLTWVSSEPWGWVPYHYGSWDYLPGYGWVWQPGSVWSAAWVYWYWGQDYVGWCPTGYYTRYYGPSFGVNIGFRSGVYGWAGGGWTIYDNWNFVSASYFRDGYRQGYRDGYWDGHRDVRRYAVPVDRHRGEIGRGIITTDTRPIKPSVWKDPGGPLRALRGRGTGELPDVTPFVARKPNLPQAVARTVISEKPQVLDGTPLRPGTLGRPGRRGAEGRPSVQGAQPGKPGPVIGGGTPAGRPVVRETPGRNGRPGGRPGPEVDGGAPNPRVIGGDRGDRGEPVVRERPERPAAEAGGGAPRPERKPVVIEMKPPARPDRSERPDTEDRQPVVRERPARPSSEADGGSPRPERRPEVEQPRPDRYERPQTQDRPQVREERQPERRPQVEERRPPEPRPEVREQRQPERKPEVREERRPERNRDRENDDRKPPRGRG